VFFCTTGVFPFENKELEMSGPGMQIAKHGEVALVRAR
jgi:hypothetical protein